MFNVVNLQLICAECPKGMNRENCPVWEYIAEEQELFQQSVNESIVSLAKPYNSARGKYEGALSKIAELCQDCQKQKGQR